MTIGTPETVREELLATSAMLAGFVVTRERLPIGVEFWCINLARRVHQACLGQRSLQWLIELPSHSIPALLFIVQEGVRQLDACHPPAGAAPRLRPVLQRRSQDSRDRRGTSAHAAATAPN